MATPRRARVEAVGAGASVTPLELFFDLVFVFALTQITDLMAGTPSVEGLIRGALILTVLWWCWVGYSWLCNVVKADEGLIRLAMFVAMGVLFVAAITIPEAFDDGPGGLFGPAVFAFCYLGFRVVHVVMFLIVARDDGVLRRQIYRFIPSMVVGTALLLLASQTSGTTQTLLWSAALVGDYVGTLLSGTNWRLNSAGHFAERHGLIVLVALGESIVATGIGIAQVPVTWPIIGAVLLGLAISGALWWAYFDVTSMITERALAAAEGTRQIPARRALRRRRAVPARPRRVHVPDDRRAEAGAHRGDRPRRGRGPGGGEPACARHAGGADGGADRPDRVRDPPLRRAAPRDPPRRRSLSCAQPSGARTQAAM